MRGLICWVVIVAVATTATANPPCAVPVPSCTVPAGPGMYGPSCQPHVPGCQCHQCCQQAGCHCPNGCPTCGPKDGPKPGPPPEEDVPKDAPPPAETHLEETGVFVAPPRTGATVGAMNRVGIEGFRLTFPEFRIGTPRLELPACFHSRTEARMQLKEGEAPYVRTGYRQVTTGGAPAAAAPEGTKLAPPADCEAQLAALQEKYAALEKQAARMEQLLDQVQGQNKGAPTPSKGPCLQPGPLEQIPKPCPTGQPGDARFEPQQPVPYHPAPSPAQQTPYTQPVAEQNNTAYAPTYYGPAPHAPQHAPAQYHPAQYAPSSHAAPQAHQQPRHYAAQPHAPQPYAEPARVQQPQPTRYELQPASYTSQPQVAPQQTQPAYYAPPAPQPIYQPAPQSSPVIRQPSNPSAQQPAMQHPPIPQPASPPQGRFASFTR